MTATESAAEQCWYLREDVYFEPLFNQWYAWPYLIPPATAARHLVNTHRRIMKSFVNNHQIHILANKERDLAGSEYLDCREDQLPSIRALIETIDAECAPLVALSQAIGELEELLRMHTSGESIEPLYARVPELLKGYVELFMDGEHRASYRLIEPLLYHSEFYRPDLQSLCFGLLARVDERPFVFSTPRLPDENHLQVQLPFADPRVDRLFAARERPLSQAELDALCDGVDSCGGLGLRDLFTMQPPLYLHAPIEDAVRVNYLGHAGFLIEGPEVSVLVDPVVASRSCENPDAVISFSELPARIDYICLTHSHQDHVNIETLLQLRYKTNKIVAPKNNGGGLFDPSIKLMLRALGFDVIEAEDLDQIAIPGGKIVAMPFLGEHGDLNIRSKAAWYIELHGRKFFFGADSSNLEHRLYEKLSNLYADFDILAVGMECVGAPYTWLYGALTTKPVSKAVKNSRRLNGSDFARALPMSLAFKPKRVFVYALGREPWYRYFTGLEYHDDSRQIVESNKMVEACRERGIEAECMYGKKSVQFDLA
ncbi:MAG: MBL fold metallo-hydrolase [Rhodanobacteraceae bacterium]|nr:MBL fold metallo-hydrolase [Rhodanobacteraceae bacterium]